MPRKKIGNFRTSVHIGFDEYGNRLTKTVRAESQTELKQKAEMIKRDFKDGKRLNESQLFGVWANKWYENTKESDKGLSTGVKTQYRSAIKHLNRYFENTKFENITLDVYQDFINELAVSNPNTNKPTSKKTLESIIKVTKSIYKYARFSKIPNTDDEMFSYVKIPSFAPQNKRRALSEQEIQWITDTEHRAQLPAMIMLFGGLRRGEVIPLQWKDIDLNKGTININKSVVFNPNQPELSNGKTENAIRTLPIPEILKKYLRQYKSQITELNQLVCPNVQGKMHSKSSWDKMWESYLIELNIKYGYPNTEISKNSPFPIPMKIDRITPHYLRHTYATILFLENINVVSAKQYLGHADIQTTVNIYTDLQRYNRNTLSDEFQNHLETDYKITA